MPKILIYDRLAVMRELYRREFQEEGYNVLITSSLRDALNVFRNESPALVLFSIEHFGVELLGTVEQMLSINRHIPIIFAGSDADAPDSGCAELMHLSLEKQSDLVALKHAIRDLCLYPDTAVRMRKHSQNGRDWIRASNTMQIVGKIA